MDYSNIPTGLKIQSQIPLNSKEWVKDEATLAYLGIDDNLAFTYHDQLEVFCLAEKKLYIWREVQPGEENTGLVPLDFTYPLLLPSTYDVNYSGKTYNFFLKEYVTIDNIQDLIQIENVGTGAEVYKGFNSTTNKHEIKTVLIDSQSGMGESFVRDIQQNTDDITVRVKKIKSNTLSIIANDEEILLNTPSSATIPALYVNNLYKPTYEDWFNAGGNVNPAFLYRGEGTLARPFTDSINYTSTVAYTITPNTAIQNALDGHPTLSYVGTGTRLAPQRNYQQIIVQNNNGFYTFPGDFNYENLNIRLSGTVVATTSGYLIDMDNTSYFNAMNGRFLITIDAGHLLELTDSLGFRNSGNTSFTPPMYDSGRIGAIYGDGSLYSSYAGGDILNRYIFTGDGNNNDNNLHFQIKCLVRADQQGVYFTKNLMRIDFYNSVQSGILLGSGDINLKALHMTGGQIRFYEKGSIHLGNEVTGRIHGVTFEPEDDGIGSCVFQLNSAKVSGNSKYCFAKLNNESVQFLAFNSPSGDGFATVIPGTLTITNGLFENLGVTKWNVDFKNNVFSYTGIDFTKVDLTGGNAYSAINFIGNSVVESLVAFDDRATAISAGIPLYSAYLKTSGVAYPTTAGWVRDIVLPA